MSISIQLLSLFIIALPVATIAWTATHEEIFREPREYCTRQYEKAKGIGRKKFFYAFTCEYCLSHYVTVVVLIITDFKMLFDDWRGYFISGFALVWIANVYMSLFALLRTDLKKEKMEAQIEEKKLKEK